MSMPSGGGTAEAASDVLEAPEAPAVGDPNTMGLVTTEGRKVQVRVVVDAVVDLRANAKAGHRVGAHIHDIAIGRDLPSADRRILLPRDFAAIDSAVMARSLELLAESEGQSAPRLIVQLSFASLSNSRIRNALVAQGAQRDHLLKQGAICEIGDVENGIPVNRLMELSALVRPYFRGVWMQAQPSRGLIETAKAARINGLSVRADDLGENPAGVARGLKAFMALAQNAGQTLTVTGLPHSDLQPVALESGFTHATMRV